MAGSGEGPSEISDDFAGRRAEPTMGPVQLAVRARLRQGQILGTPTRHRPLKVGRIDGDGVVLLLGKRERPVTLVWESLEGVVPFLEDRGMVAVAGRSGALEQYLQGWGKRSTAGLVAALLEESGIVEVIRERPAQVRLAAIPEVPPPRGATRATESPPTPEELELRNEVARFEGRE